MNNAKDNTMKHIKDLPSLQHGIDFRRHKPFAFAATNNVLAPPPLLVVSNGIFGAARQLACAKLHMSVAAVKVFVTVFVTVLIKVLVAVFVTVFVID